jgi:hypothetical protein
LDPLWSTETLEFVHDGINTSRSKKVIDTICKSDLALQHLRVCWKNYFNKYNCARCEKCLRTMIALHIGTGAVSFPTFQKTLKIKTIRRMKLSSATAITFARENLALIPQTNTFNRQLSAALEEAIEKRSRETKK